jgi:hypothetical protein
MTALKSLSRSISEVLDGNLQPVAVPASLQAELRRLESCLRRAGGGPPQDDRLRAAISYFRQTGEIPSLTFARAVCFGVAAKFGNNPPIIEDLTLFPKVLGAADQYSSDPRKFRRCYRGLVHSYFAYDGEGVDATEGRNNWVSLRDFLYRRRKSIVLRGVAPDWVRAVEDHANLFTDTPVDRYGKALLDGDNTAINQLKSDLEVNDKSWLIRRLVMSQVKAAVEETDSYFAARVSDLLDLLAENPLVEDEALILLLNRYTAMSSPTAHANLRDRSVERWGNPWLERNTPKWSRVNASARSLVTGWLKRDLISQFFELLSEDGRTDTRRVKFWDKYHESIDDMYFALGKVTYGSRNADIQALRAKMGERLLTLSGSANSAKNAFVMLIGSVAVVEFGSKGNACYVFNRDKLPFPLTGALRGDSSDLRHDSHERRLLHMDGSERWETKFAAALSQFGIRPAVAGVKSASLTSADTRNNVPRNVGAAFDPELVKKFCRREGIEVIDHLPKGGNFWVLHEEQGGAVATQLMSWGFKFKDKLSSGAWYWSPR